MPGTLVLGEVAEGKPQSITNELLAAGRGMSDALHGEVAVALLGSGLDGAAQDAISHGADRVYLVEDPILAEPHVDAQLAAFDHLCRQVEPSVVLVGKTSLGRDLGPAPRLSTGRRDGPRLRRYLGQLRDREGRRHAAGLRRKRPGEGGLSRRRPAGAYGQGQGLRAAGARPGQGRRGDHHRAQTWTSR